MPASTPTEYWLKGLHPTPAISAGNRVVPLVDGPDTFAEIHRIVGTTSGKEHFVYLLGWSLDDTYPLLPSQAKSSLFELIKARRHVEVRVMLWQEAFSSLLELTRPVTGALRPPTSPARTPNRKAIDHLNTLENVKAIWDGHLPAVWMSHHQKLIVVNGSEGLIGLCGGVDIHANRVEISGKQAATSTQANDTVSSKPAPTPQHDVHCIVQGPASKDLLNVFEQRWGAHPESRGQALRSKERPLVVRASGSVYAQIVRTVNQVQDKAVPVSLAEARRVSGQRNYNGCVKEHSVATSLISMIQKARQFIYIEDQYMIDPLAAKELAKARDHVQHIVILIPHTEISDLPEADFRRKAFIARITASYPVRKKFADGHLSTFNVYYKGDVERREFGPYDYIHAKTWIIDDEIAMVGSANCNRRGLSSDSEVGAIFFDNQNADDGMTTAQRLRVKLWANHLNLAPSEVRRGLQSCERWMAPPSGSRVKLYTPLKNDRADSPIRPRPLLDKLVDDDWCEAPKCTRN